MNDQSLVEIKTVEKDNHSEPSHFFSLHDLIHQLIQESIPMEDKRKLIDDAAKVMLEIFSGPLDVFVTKITRDPIHLLQAQKLCKSAKEAGYSSADLLKLKVCIFQCFMNGTRDFEAAKMIREEINADLKAGLTLPPYYEGVLKFSEGFLEAIFTHCDNAIPYMKKALLLFQTSGDHKDEALCSLINLVQYYDMCGEIEKAEPLIRQGEELVKRSTSMLSNGGFLYVLSLVLIDQGKFQAAEEAFSKAETYPTLSEDSPAIYHGLLLQKTAALIKQGKLAEALKMLKICEDTTNAFFQDRNNTSLPNILLLKSLIVIKKREISPDLFKDLEEALLGFNNFYKGEKKQRRQAYTYFAMGKAYGLQKDYTKALQNYLTSDEVYTKVLKNKKIDDVSELYMALTLLGQKLKNEGLRQKYLKEHIEIFGLDHPRTKELLVVFDESGAPVF